ncbi:MAG: lamin tail domain-containing protein [Oligoflexia bacterium]|nr:lamin tail domain-containing protein [Oligoflexia bacterium]
MTRLLIPMTLSLAISLLAGCDGKTDGGTDTASVEDCTDGVDNDGNGVADCADPACKGAAECTGLTDGGTTDAGATDAGNTDAGTGDGGTTDSGTADGGTTGVTASPGDVFINEFMASNQTTITDESGSYPDWFELYNPGSEPLSLAGWTTTDDLAIPDKFAFDSSLSVPAGGFLLLWADNDKAEGPNHVGFNLAAAGEDLAIYDAAGTRIDALSYGKQVTDISAARVPDGGDTWILTDAPTPGSTNNSSR